jgi:hypothetical protein
VNSFRYFSKGVRDPGIDCAFDSWPEALIIEPDYASLLFRLSKVSLHLRQNFCFFGLQEFFVQLLFGSAELKMKSVNALCADSISSIFSNLSIAKLRKFSIPAHNII